LIYIYLCRLYEIVMRQVSISSLHPLPESLFLRALTEIKPYQSPGKNKKDEVELMFDKISGNYDLLNRLLSLGIDRNWRKKALSILIPFHPQDTLDVATGTGDLAFMTETLLHPKTITGIDLSAGMLEVANKRLKLKISGSDTKITFIKGDAEALPFDTNQYDAATVAFGVRNFADLQAGLKEMHRVLKPGSPIIVLEFTKPRIFPFKQLFNIYFKHLLPLIGAWTSGDRRAYRYLFESVQAFPDYESFNQELIKAGFSKPSYKPLSLGICAIYVAYKL
jgi:demethylmenaquinone methyltransferase / 2-methoxy-6-polyprenyl-1,4-benzoquinol methylase